MKMFNNITIYKYEGLAPSPEVLRDHKLIDIPVGLSSTSGFTFADDRSFVFAVNEKVVPASAIKKALEKEIDELRAKWSRKPTKNEKADAKIRVIAQLTDQALTKTAEIQGYFDNGYLVINSPSVKLCELVCSGIRYAVEKNSGIVSSVTWSNPELTEVCLTEGVTPSSIELEKGYSIFPCKPICDEPITHELNNLLRAWNQPENFRLDQSFFLYNPITPSTKVRFVSYGADRHVTDQLDEGMSAHAVGLTMDDRLDFVLTEDCQVKSIKFKDICFVYDTDGYDSDEEAKKAEEDADWAIMKAEFKRLIEAIEVNFIKGEQDEV